MLHWLTLMCLTLLPVVALPQAPPPSSGNTAWFGAYLPPRVGAEPAVLIGARAPRPVSVPPGEAAHPELHANSIRKDLEAIVAFAKESRARHEIGSGQLWGRVSGFPSSTRTIDWAAEQFRGAGIKDVKIQSIEQDARSPFWLPLSWEVRLIGEPAFGAGTTDIVLESAMPVVPSEIPGGTLTAPLVFVGAANPALLQHIDVRGKIAVQLIVPQGHTLFERSNVTARAQDLMQRGAVAVLNLIRLPGNELTRDFSNCGGPCFNLGGHDGLFVENILDRASSRGLHNKVLAKISLKTESRTGLKAQNAVAVIPGRQSDETVIVDAHVDAWFDGAGDNADGLAVMVALARHFSRPEHQPRRTLVFIASAGHHSPGMNGPRNFVRANPELVAKAVLVLNIEHVAQRNFSPARSTAEDGYRHAVADSGEAPIVAGVSNRAPYLDSLMQEGVLRYGTNFVSQTSSMQTGETGGFAEIDAARVTIMQAPPLYHTSGEVLEAISTPGLERIARFLAYFLRQVDAAPREQLNPA